jgi:hypothetical protein
MNDFTFDLEHIGNALEEICNLAIVQPHPPVCCRALAQSIAQSGGRCAPKLLTEPSFADTLFANRIPINDADLDEYAPSAVYREPPEAVKAVHEQAPNGPGSRGGERNVE